MRARNIVIALAVIAFLLFALAPALAQTGSVKAKIDFPFWVGDTQFPPGEYIFKTPDSNNHFVTVINASKEQRVSMTQDLPLFETTNEDKLIFRQENGRMILHQIRTAGDKHAHNLSHAAVVVDVY